MREDWVECTLDDVLVRLSNGSSVKQYKEKVGLPISRIETIWNESIDDSRVKFIEENDLDFINKYKLKRNDILLSHINSDSHLGKTAIYKNYPETLIHGINLLLLRPTPHIIADFLLQSLRYLKIQGRFIEYAQRSVNQSSINQRKLKTFLLSLPPLPEQRAIVAKIESLFSELDSGIANLKTAQAQLKIYRQAVLKKAFEGELTKEWREKQRDLPTADELLKQIKEERQKHYEQQIEDWKKAVKLWEKNGKDGKKPSKPKIVKSTTEFSQVEIQKMDELPKNWRWVRLGNIFQVFVGSTPKRNISDYWEDGTINWVSSGEVAFRSIFDTKEKVTIKGLKNTSTLVHPIGTVMLAMIGEGKTRGQAGILKVEACHNQNTAAIRVAEIGFEPNFLFNYLSLKYERNRRVGSGNNQKALNQTRIMDFDYPLCSVQEQHQIVLEIESRLSVCDKLEESVTESLAKAEALRQSILKKAFEGKLLTEAELAACKLEKDWEPASKLLERIKEEKNV